MLAGLTGGLLAAVSRAFGGEDAAARKNGNQKKKRKNKKAKVRADAICPGPNDDGGISIVFADGRAAQTFTALRSGPLVGAELLIGKLNGTFGDYILQLGRVDSFGVPTNEVLASTSVANGNVPGGESMVGFSFAKPFSVVAGAQYALILARPGAIELLWRGHFGDTCAGRAFASDNLTAPFDGVSIALDLIFTTFVRS